MHQNKETQSLEKKILNYLEEHNTISLATVSEGKPHAASVFYVNVGFELFYVSNPESRHSRYLSSIPFVSGTIDEDYHNWLEIKGIQLEGKVSCIGGIMKNPGITKVYVSKFQNVKDFFTSPEKLGENIVKKVAGVKFYKIIPSRLLFIDNSLGFGHRKELILTDL